VALARSGLIFGDGCGHAAWIDLVSTSAGQGQGQGQKQ
jgi:hypothetical protein